MRMMILTTLTAMAINALSISAKAQNYVDYNFMLEPMGSIVTSCTDNREKKESKVELLPMPDKAGANYIPLTLKMKLCLKTWGFKRANILVNVPKDAMNETALLAMSEGQTSEYSDIPSTQTSGRMLKISIVRLAEKQIKLRRGGTTTGIPFRMTWLKGDGSVAEYLPITLVLAKDPAVLSPIAGYVLGQHLPLLRIELDHNHKMLRGTLQMRGNLGVVTVE